ncbi:CPBP family intramembrane metalloprotease, partial [Escherichia coli]|nr:CPBP family intramembrane metalloprotease [Escherichia coli]
VILVSWILWGPPLTEANESPAALGLSLPLMLILLVSVVNPLFEETFVVGFVMRFLEWRGVPRWPLVALCISVVIRVAYHLYQGVDAIPLHLFMAILFAGMFLWRRNLWPLVLAHGLLNLQGFLPYLL